MKTIYSWIAASVVIVAVMAGPAKAQSGKSSDGAKPAVAVFRLSGSLVESPLDESFPFGENKSISLRDLVQRLKKAQDDKEVKAIVLTLESVSMGRRSSKSLASRLPNFALPARMSTRMPTP